MYKKRAKRKKKMVVIIDPKKHRLLLAENERLMLDVAELQKNVDCYAAPFVSGLSSKKNTKNKQINDFIADKNALESKMFENMHKNIRERMRLEDIISKIEDEEGRYIIRLRVINGKTWDEIGEAINSDRRTASRKFLEITGFLDE